MASVDVIVTGQSNAFGQTSTRVNATTAVQPSVLAWYGLALSPTTPQWKTAPWKALDSRYKSYETGGSRQFTGIPEAITYRLQATLGHSPRLLNFAVGSSSYANHWPTAWPGSFGFLQRSQHEISEALASRRYPGTPDRRVIVCVHGETDATNEALSLAYDGYLDTIMAGFRTALGDANAHVIVVQLHTSCSSTYTANVRSAQSSWVTSEGANATLIDGSSHTLHSDNLHYTEAGAQSLGYAIADIIDGLLP